MTVPFSSQTSQGQTEEMAAIRAANVSGAGRVYSKVTGVSMYWLMERDAYQWNAGLSVYLDTASRSKRRGTALYRTLIDMLVLQNIRTVFGIVTLPNAASERLHESLGFSRTGLYRNTGYKCGKWHDVVWFEKTIAPHTPDPIPFIPIGKIAAGQLAAIQQKYRQTLR